MEYGFETSEPGVSNASDVVVPFVSVFNSTSRHMLRFLYP